MRPSIMSLGATMSAPARACETAVRAMSSTLESLSTAPSARSSPQWPWSVYSQRQTSVMTSRSGVRLLDRARGELDDPLVVVGARALGVLVGVVGMPKSRTAGSPSARAAPASSTAVEIDRRSTPGSEAIGARPSAAVRTKSGRTRSEAVRRVSRTSSRSTGVARSRRMRVAGNGMSCKGTAARAAGL